MKSVAAFTQEISKGWKKSVLVEALTNNHSINCLNFEENTRKEQNIFLSLFNFLAFCLQGTDSWEEEYFFNGCIFT